MIQETILPFNQGNIRTKDSLAVNEGSFYTGFFIVENTEITTITRSTVCQKNIPCCADFIDTTNIKSIPICEGSSYTLPDRTVVQDSGRYYVTNKTQKGCDSISLYHISVDKNPSKLLLSSDTCFNRSTSITLQATGGYNQYTWMKNYVTRDSNYKAKDTGVYTVNVTNVCGSKTDSVHVYNQCDFPIYIPNAFTPNDDRLNDVFKVPSLNLDKFVQLTIYNRWGKIIFHTSNINVGWEGTVNSFPQEQGIYIYTLEMKNLLGKNIFQKGTFTLIR